MQAWQEFESLTVRQQERKLGLMKSETDWGIEIIKSPDHVEYISFGTYNEAESAKHDWQRDCPDYIVSLASRTVYYSDWEIAG